MSPPASLLPDSMIHWLDEIPKDAPIALLLRHAEREPLPPGEVGDAVPITEEGERAAHALGRLLRRRMRSLRTSPVPRCVQTAEALVAGSGRTLTIQPDRLLGAPGVYVIDGDKAWSTWLELGQDAVVAHLETGEGQLPGLADPEPAAHLLVQHMLATGDGEPGIHVFVTHDIIIGATVARMTDRAQAPDHWPRFLEGALFWRDEERVALVYRDELHLLPPS